jgi:hypothetical protein
MASYNDLLSVEIIVRTLCAIKNKESSNPFHVKLKGHCVDGKHNFL